MSEGAFIKIEVCYCYGSVSYYSSHEERRWKSSVGACSCSTRPLRSSLVKWLVKGQGWCWLAHWGQDWIKTRSYKGSEHQVADSVLEGNEEWKEPTEETENVKYQGSGLMDWRIKVFTVEAERRYSPPEWAWAILHQSVWGWSCLLGTHHSPPAPESYKGACPCQGFHSGFKKGTKNKTKAVTPALHLLACKRPDLHWGSRVGPDDTNEGFERKWLKLLLNMRLRVTLRTQVRWGVQDVRQEASEQLKRGRTEMRGLRGRTGAKS